MSSLMARLTLPAYLLLAALLHTSLCHATAASLATAAATAGNNWRLDAKAIDQVVAYVLMLVALFVTYIVH